MKQHDGRTALVGQIGIVGQVDRAAHLLTGKLGGEGALIHAAVVTDRCCIVERSVEKTRASECTATNET